MPNFIDRSGQRFNQLTIIKRAQNRGKKTYWLCQCDCGKFIELQGGNIVNGHTTHCGHNIASHGMSNVPEHKTFDEMHYRCSPDYEGWGSRGIRVCDRWTGAQGFINFYNDMGQKPSIKHSIDRINNNGNYTPKNCRWATQKQQCNNKRNHVFLTHNRKTLNASQWSEITGLSSHTIRRRLKDGWSIHDTLTKPPRKIVHT